MEKREVHPPSPIRIGKGPAPLSFLPLSSFLPLLLLLGRGNPTLGGSRTPPSFLVLVGEGKEGEEKKKERRPGPLVQLGLG